MRVSPRLCLRFSLARTFSYDRRRVFNYDVPEPLVKIKDGSFYRQHPDLHDATTSQGYNPPLFPQLTFSLPSRPLHIQEGRALSHTTIQQHWAVLGGSGKTDFLNVLRGRHISIPPTARSYPYLSTEGIQKKDKRLVTPDRAIQYVGFSGENTSSSGGVRGAYLSARYESRKEETDWTVLQYLRGETELNPARDIRKTASAKTNWLRYVMQSLNLEKLESMPISSLSNGQTRRARIAKALLTQPEALLLDEPFMGLDPPTLVTLSTMLRKLAHRSKPRIVLSLRPQDPIPQWITHLIYIGSDNRVAFQGPVYSVVLALKLWAHPTKHTVAISKANELTEMFGQPPTELGKVLTHRGIVEDSFLSQCVSSLRSQDLKNIASFFLEHSQKVSDESKLQSVKSPKILAAFVNRIEQLSRGCTPEAAFKLGLLLTPTLQPFGNHHTSTRIPSLGNKSTANFSASETPLIELEDVVVKYGSKVVLGGSIDRLHNRQGFNFVVQSGMRLAIVGPNGSGKTTLLSLLTSDHPQSYSLPVKFFGRARLPSPGNPGISLFDIQSQIGHSSPEIQAFFPRHLTIRQTIESAFSDTFLGKPSLNEEVNNDVDAILNWFAPQLNAHHDDGQDVVESASPAWATSKATCFGVLSFHQQRLLLLLRAIVKKPRIIILDEAFSGFPPELRERAMCFLECGETMTPRLPHVSTKSERHGTIPRSSNPDVRKRAPDGTSPAIKRPLQDEDGVETNFRFTGLTKDQALVVVSHVKEEIPTYITEWLRLPGEEEIAAGKQVERGRCDPGALRTDSVWNAIWNYQLNGKL